MISISDKCGKGRVISKSSIIVHLIAQYGECENQKNTQRTKHHSCKLNCEYITKKFIYQVLYSRRMFSGPIHLNKTHTNTRIQFNNLIKPMACVEEISS
eukprot:UN21247